MNYGSNGYHDADQEEWLAHLQAKASTTIATSAVDMPADRMPWPPVRASAKPAEPRSELADTIDALVDGRTVNDEMLGILHAAATTRAEFLRKQRLRNAIESAASIEEIDRVIADFQRDDSDEPFGLVSAAEFATRDYTRTFYVDQVVVKGQNGILSAGFKMLKTTILSELAVSMATGTRFFGKWIVPMQIRVGIFSGESGASTTFDTFNRIAKSKGFNGVADVPNLFLPDIRDNNGKGKPRCLPRLTDPADVQLLKRIILRNKLEFCGLDPTYLMMPDVETSQLSAVGALLFQLTDVSNETGCTLFIVNHNRKTLADPHVIPELQHMAGAGYSEWCRQWVLVNRRQKYDPESGGIHKLWMTYGGSAGHSGGVALDIDERPTVEGDLSTRRWEYGIRKMSEAIEEANDTQTSEKQLRREAEKNAAFLEHRKKVLLAFQSYGEVGATDTDLKYKTKLSGTYVGQVVASLLEEKVIEPCEIVKPNRNKPYPGHKLLLTKDPIEEGSLC